MVKNKAAHCILGLTVILISIVLYHLTPHSTRFFWIITAGMGLFWASIIGHLGFFITPLISLVYYPFVTPFRLLRYGFFNPIRIKGNVPICVDEFFSYCTGIGDEILAYTTLAPQAIALLRKVGIKHLAVDIAYRRTGIITSAINLLEIRSIPHIDLTEITKYTEELSKQWPQLKKSEPESDQFWKQLSKFIYEIEHTYMENGISVFALILFYHVNLERRHYREPESIFGRVFY